MPSRRCGCGASCMSGLPWFGFVRESAPLEHLSDLEIVLDHVIIGDGKYFSFLKNWRWKVF